ncbi:hypothetical protein [Flagellimonas sp. CMM7]|uniref:OB-fold protein n=1 Tax=Flagellimonas sp. CMM7 TaxID=2654676 RepID=UPI0013D1BAEE|nr:hypothetical protein [Flagellimonas sp. CMM7]UII80307.1 OB-fold putative lipoprotein [Flagellimonas sp. CMM7]
MNKKTKKRILGIVLIGIFVAMGIVLYLFNMPQRDVQASKIDFRISAKEIVAEYLANADSANDKYLQEEGDSKILAVTGTVASIDTDLNNQKVVLLKNADEEAGVSSTFMAETNSNAEALQIGDKVTIKGVIRSGAGYDEDLDLYEDVIMEKCDVLKE